MAYVQVLQHKWVQQGPLWQGASVASTFSLTGDYMQHDYAVDQ